MDVFLEKLLEKILEKQCLKKIFDDRNIPVPEPRSHTLKICIIKATQFYDQKLPHSFDFNDGYVNNREIGHVFSCVDNLHF